MSFFPHDEGRARGSYPSLNLLLCSYLSVSSTSFALHICCLGWAPLHAAVRSAEDSYTHAPQASRGNRVALHARRSRVLART